MVVHKTADIMVFYLLIVFAIFVNIAMSIKVQQITESLFIGEGPHWDAKQQALYFVSIGVVNRIHKYVPATGVHNKTKIDGRAGFIVPLEGTCNQFLMGVERKFQVVRWNGREGSPASVVKELGEVDRDVPTNRLNDGKADPRGRVFAGTISRGLYPFYDPNKSSLFRLDGSKITKVVDRVTVSNGVAWDLNQKAMYYTDSTERKIRRYDYDVATGDISNLTYIFDFKKNGLEGYPDGTTSDTDGNLWVAAFDGSCVLKIDHRTGKLLQKVPIPVSLVSSVTFGGPNMDILFVTTANLYFRGPQDGATFMVTGLGVKGSPNYNFKL